MTSPSSNIGPEVVHRTEDPSRPVAEIAADIITALQEAADRCLMRVRQPDDDHPGEWVCTWLDALDVVQHVVAEQHG